MIIFFLVLSFLIDGKITELVVISIFTLAIVYGYFFNKSTNKIIQANFSERKAKYALKELNESLEKRVREQTKEIKRAYEVEKKARKDLENLNEAKTQFIMATQHHLRTPLTSMQGYVDLLLAGNYGKLSKRVAEIMEKFKSSTKNEIKLVNEFLDISQFQIGKEVVLLREGVEVQPILEEAISDLQIECQKKGIYLKLEISQNMPSVKADCQKLKAAIYNIIDNAVKYTTKGGVTIKLQNKNSKLLIIVKDTGVGIIKERQKDLFDKLFERGEDAMKFFATGRGIGLFIASKIVAAHKGKIWAESEGKNKGSTFYIELPITN